MNRWMPDDPWILVMNMTRARILRGLKHEGEAAPAELVVRAANQHLRDIMADRPGRSHASSRDGRRSSMDYGSDPLREDTLVFIREVASMLDAHRRAGEFGELVVFASPHALGLIRSELPQALSDCIVREVAKNLVPLSPAQLAERVKQELETP